ncbi:MAG: MarR family winged helix-turn-helix transcriptional regulator [Minisyncoccota bacterium]
MRKITASKQTHAPRDVARAMSLFSAVRRIMRTRFAQGKKLDPSTWLQIETVKFIADHDKPMMKDIADYLSITAPSATALVGELAKSGLVTSHIGERDRRTSRLALTKKGRAELGKAVARGTRLMSGLFATLSDAELAAFIGALERIKKAASTRTPGNNLL